jgi:hypothetical protein
MDKIKHLLFYLFTRWIFVFNFSVALNSKQSKKYLNTKHSRANIKLKSKPTVTLRYLYCYVGISYVLILLLIPDDIITTLDDLNCA